MRVLSCIQGTQEWLQLRCGIPTASEFDRILTPKGKPSIQAENFMYGLLSERIMGRPRTEAVSFWMERGSVMEAEAVAFYEFQKDIETVPVGLITNDAGTIGASPDRLVGDDGLAEFKCPAEHTHVAYLLGKAVDQTYYPQLQGQLWITERKWVEICSYHPAMPPVIVRVERDEQYIEMLSKAVTAFSQFLEAKAAELIERGWIKVSPSASGDGAGLVSGSAPPLTNIYVGGAA